MFRLAIDDDLELRLFEERHGDELYALVERNRAHLREWMFWADQSREDVSEFIKSALRNFASGESVQSGIWYQGRMAGGIGLQMLARMFGKMEMGYWISEDLQGKGLVTRSCRALLGFAFDELKLNRVEIHVAIGNDRSTAIPERMGFTREGVLRGMGWRAGKHVDLIIYGMLASDWAKPG